MLAGAGHQQARRCHDWWGNEAKKNKGNVPGQGKLGACLSAWSDEQTQRSDHDGEGPRGSGAAAAAAGQRISVEGRRGKGLQGSSRVRRVFSCIKRILNLVAGFTKKHLVFTLDKALRRNRPCFPRCRRRQGQRCVRVDRPFGSFCGLQSESQRSQARPVIALRPRARPPRCVPPRTFGSGAAPAHARPARPAELL